MNEQKLLQELEQLKQEVMQLKENRGFFSLLKQVFRRTSVLVGVVVAAVLSGIILYAAQVTFTDGTVISATDVNANFTELYGRSVPSGAVMYFNLTNCPTGWSELTNSRGRYIVGLTSGGALGSQVGTSLYDQENRVVGQHNHTITDSGHSHSLWSKNDDFTCSGDAASQWGIARCQDNGSYTWQSEYASITTSNTNITVNNNGSTSGTNAPYIQLLCCIKN